MSWDSIPILIILVLAAIGNNHTVTIAAVVLLLIQKLGLVNCFSFIDNYGMNAGIIILTIAVLSPVAQGRIASNEIAGLFKAPVGIVAIIIGILVAWIAGQGVFFMKESPEITTALIVGTIIGVCFFRGLPVGPLIAGGMVALVVNLLGLVKR
ncbi:hypothetical protein P22_2925 [Propionispora sp. 2/2-37]|uniref:DUF441 domain-containing protein n=1 Tax=Propionispora sp. 2/2-37 TaxID=1677858 RepID=UPI0006BB6724|nr:DUF441 domain-containing protein [Propionispora sp. 2/2-37]CUH96814.1 hypothetical protein P22_2925 [Propionispora sp. 2/2-37]